MLGISVKSGEVVWTWILPVINEFAQGVAMGGGGRVYVSMSGGFVYAIANMP
jgi:hypothetical protein